MSRRLFLAIRIPVEEKIRDYITDYQHQFGFCKMRWVDEEYLHITLKFFGKTDEKTYNKIKKTIGNALINQSKFTFSISKLAIFGSKNSPKTLWWGINEEDYIKQLASKLQNEFDTIGIFADRQNFVPHISLARIIKLNSTTFFQKQLKSHNNVGPIEIKVDRIVLMESKLTTTKPEYIEIAEYLLN